MCAHMIWGMSTYQRVSEVMSLLKEFVYIREFICLQMNQFYYLLRNCWKQIVPRIEANKISALINFFWPVGTAALPLWNVTKETQYHTPQHFLPHHTGNPVYGTGLFFLRMWGCLFCLQIKHHENKIHVLILFSFCELCPYSHNMLWKCVWNIIECPINIISMRQQILGNSIRLFLIMSSSTKLF